MLRTIRKGLYKSNNVRFLALLIAVAFVLLTEMACVGNMTAKAETAGDVAASVYADTEVPGVATPTSVVEKTALKMNSSTYVFTNSTDGMFRLSFAEGESYFIGSGEDSDTLITYALIRYNSKFYLVAADDSDANVEYNGSYTDTSFEMLKSANYNSSSRYVNMSVKSGNTIELKKFTFARDYSVALTGYYNGVYYSEGSPATGLFTRSGYCDYFVSGKAVVGDGWYKYGSSSPAGELVDADISGSMSGNDVKYIQLFDGHVVSAYHGNYFYSYNGTVRITVKNKAVMVNNIKVLFDKNGNAYKGLRTENSRVYYYEAGIPVKNVVKQFGEDYYYFGSDGAAVRSTWITSGNCVYYFAVDGKAIRRMQSGRLYQYSSGKWTSTATCVYEVNRRYYYFVNGAKSNVTKWYEISRDKKYYIRNGEATYFVQVDGIRYRCQKVASEGGWTAAVNAWIPSFGHVVLHTDSTGISDAIYYRSTHTVSGYADTYRVFSNNRWIVKKNSVVRLQDNCSYFGKTGKAVRTKGWQTISDYSAAYVGDEGTVTEYVYYDESTGYSEYRSGKLLNDKSEGLKNAKINNKKVYYFSDANGRCSKLTKIVVGDVEYEFDSWGRCFKTDSISWDFDEWMKRVVNEYLGKTGIYCNVFVANALRYAGSSTPGSDMSVKYTDFANGGFVISSSNICSDWALRKVIAKAILAQNGSWGEATDYELTADREDFSYDVLLPGDIVVYYTNGEPTHVGIYFGKFSSATALKQYLRKLGVPASACEAYVHDWGSNSGNKPEYWIIQGGMGSSDQVYISNSAYDLSGQYAMKIIHVRH